MLQPGKIPLTWNSMNASRSAIPFHGTIIPTSDSCVSHLLGMCMYPYEIQDTTPHPTCAHILSYFLCSNEAFYSIIPPLLVSHKSIHASIRSVFRSHASHVRHSPPY